MSKKGKTYLLVVVVLGIWGAIGYQIYSKLSPDELPVMATNSSISFSPKQEIAKDTFSISAAHHDPFMGTAYQKKNASNGKRITSNKKDSIIFPQIAYKGVISKQQSASNIYIIEVSGTQQLFKVGKQFNDVKLIKGDKKSVMISFKGKRKTISVAN